VVLSRAPVGCSNGLPDNCYRTLAIGADNGVEAASAASCTRVRAACMADIHMAGAELFFYVKLN
jgi:hypothetical protein